MDHIVASGGYLPNPGAYHTVPGSSTLPSHQETYFERLLRAKAEQEVEKKAEGRFTGMSIIAPPPSSVWNTSTKSLIPDQTSPTADIHPSRRCKELLRAKMAAEQTLTSPASTQNSPNFSAYTQALAMHQAAQTVFNLSSVAAHHTSTDTGPKSNAIQATNGPIAPSFTYSYTYRDPAGDIAFAPRTIVGPAPSNNGTGGQVASDPNVRPPDDLRSVDLNITGYPVLQHAQNVEGAAETTPPAFEYWAPPPGTSTFEPTPYPPMDSTKLGYQKSAGASSPSFERDCSPFPPTYVWPQASQQSFNGQSANSLIPASRVSLDGAPPTSFDSFLNAYPYMWNERISRPTVDERIATPPQPPAELPKLSRKTTDSSVPLLPSHVNDTYQASPPAFASLVQRELRFAPHAGSRRQGQRESHEGLEPPIPSPTASTSSHASIHVAVSSPINQRMSLYATMDGVGPLSGQGNYISAMEGQANGGSASMYDNVGSSASGSGSNGGNDGANGHNSGYDLGGHRVGGSGDGDGDGDGEGEGEGDGGVDDEQRRQKKLSLACHFCRRRKLKCDGTRPTCDNCSKRNEVCSYDEAVRRRGPGKKTKEMRDRAAREAEAAGLTNANSAGMGVGIGGGPGPSTLAELELKKGKKRKSEGASDVEKRPKMEDEDGQGPGPGTGPEGLGIL